MHPGRAWALDTGLTDNATGAQVANRINAILDKFPPRTDHAALVEEMLMTFRQDDGPQAPKDETSPLTNVIGPTDDEAGGADDD